MSLFLNSDKVCIKYLPTKHVVYPLEVVPNLKRFGQQVGKNLIKRAPAANGN